MNNLAATCCAFLDGDEGSAEILNDALELSGFPRVAESGNYSERVELVLEKILPRDHAEKLVCDFAEHVFPVAKADKKLAKDFAELMDCKRKLIAGEVTYEELSLAAQSSLAGWNSDNSPKSLAIWTGWAAAMASPRHAALTAQSVRDDEVIWQIERMKEYLLSENVF